MIEGAGMGKLGLCDGMCDEYTIEKGGSMRLPRQVSRRVPRKPPKQPWQPGTPPKPPGPHREPIKPPKRIPSQPQRRRTHKGG
jgi:hypothetical protein